MDDWFEATRQQLEALAQNLERRVDGAVNDALEASDRLAEQIDQAIAPALKTIDKNIDQWEADVAQQVEAWLPEVPAEAVEDFERRVDEWTVSTGEAIGVAVRPIEQTVKPMINQHSPCIGCRNYHGEAYGEGAEMLICGFHPFGYDADQCPDWASTWSPENNA